MVEIEFTSPWLAKALAIKLGLPEPVVLAALQEILNEAAVKT